MLRLKSVLGSDQDITYSTAIHRLSHHFSTRNEGWSDMQVIKKINIPKPHKKRMHLRVRFFQEESQVQTLVRPVCRYELCM